MSIQQLKKPKGTKPMTEYWIMFGIIAGWIALQMWILPRFGIQT